MSERHNIVPVTREELAHQAAEYLALCVKLERVEKERDAALKNADRLGYLYTQQMNALVRPLMTYADWLSAIDTAAATESAASQADDKASSLPNSASVSPASAAVPSHLRRQAS